MIVCEFFFYRSGCARPSDKISNIFFLAWKIEAVKFNFLINGRNRFAEDFIFGFKINKISRPNVKIFGSNLVVWSKLAIFEQNVFGPKIFRLHLFRAETDFIWKWGQNAWKSGKFWWKNAVIQDWKKNFVTKLIFNV